MNKGTQKDKLETPKPTWEPTLYAQWPQMVSADERTHYCVGGRAGLVSHAMSELKH